MEDARLARGTARCGPRRRLAGRGQDLQVLPPGEMAVEPGLVDDGPDPGQRPVAMFRDGVAEQRHRAGVGVGQAQQDPDEGGLAGAVGAEVAEGTAPGDQQLHAVDGDVVPEPLGQPVGLDRPVAVEDLVRGGSGQCGGGHSAGALPSTKCLAVHDSKR